MSDPASAAQHFPRTVLHVLNDAHGGAALSTIGLMQELGKLGIRSAAVCHDHGGAGDREILRDVTGGNVVFTRLIWWNKKIRSPLWRRPAMALKQAAATRFGSRSTNVVVAAAQKFATDIIHTNTILTPEGGYASRLLRLPHVWHLREMIGPAQPFRFWNEGPAFGSRLLRLCDQVIANSKASAAAIEPWLPRDLLTTIPNGIDLAKFSDIPDRPAKDTVVVGMVGNLTSAWKRHALFLKAAARVPVRQNIRFHLYGADTSHAAGGPGDAYADGLHALAAQLGIADRVVWCGFVDNPRTIMEGIDVLVHPAEQESFGRIAVEAMAASRPVIGMNAGGVAEIVVPGETGYLCAPLDADTLAARISELAGDRELRRKMGAAGRARALTTYTLSACAAHVADAYAKAIARAPQRFIR